LSEFLSLAQLDGSALRPATLGFRPSSYAADSASGWFGCGAITTDGCADEPVAKAQDALQCLVHMAPLLLGLVGAVADEVIFA